MESSRELTSHEPHNLPPLSSTGFLITRQRNSKRNSVSGKCFTNNCDQSRTKFTRRLPSLRKMAVTAEESEENNIPPYNETNSTHIIINRKRKTERKELSVNTSRPDKAPNQKQEGSHDIRFTQCNFPSPPSCPKPERLTSFRTRRSCVLLSSSFKGPHSLEPNKEEPSLQIQTKSNYKNTFDSQGWEERPNKG